LKNALSNFSHALGRENNEIAFSRDPDPLSQISFPSSIGNRTENSNSRFIDNTGRRFMMDEPIPLAKLQSINPQPAALARKKPHRRSVIVGE
jgi:hypothetical protein